MKLEKGNYIGNKNVSSRKVTYILFYLVCYEIFLLVLSISRMKD